MSHGVRMATHLHSSSVSLLCRQRFSFCSSSLPASASTLLHRAIKSCSSHTFTHYVCSPLRVHCKATPDYKQIDQQPVKIHDDIEFPPLVASMTMTGLPPCRESMYADEALACMLERWPFHWLEPHNRVWNSFASFLHCSVVSCDRLTVMTTVYTLFTFFDDNLFDMQSDIHLQEVGIDHNILGSPSCIRKYLHSVDTLLRQEEPLENPTQIQEMIWKLGCDLRELSNPEWFEVFADAILDFNMANLESYSAELVGDRTYITDLESFTQKRIRNSGSVVCTLGVEFCNNLYLPSEIREHPVVQKLTEGARTYFSYVNDIFSYSREQADESQSRNLIKALMELGDMSSLPQAAWRAVNMTNSVAQDFLEVETQTLSMWEDEPWALAVRRYVEGLKELMSGDLYWHSLQKRYRHHKAPFPEMRDVSNASFCPKAKDIKCV